MRLRSANIGASAGSLREIARVVEQIRQRWPGGAHHLACRQRVLPRRVDELVEQNVVDYVFGFARNERLRRLIAEAMGQAARQYQETQKPARVFVEFAYQATTGLGACTARGR